MAETMQLETLVQDFLEHIELEKGRSTKTIENYRHYLSRFLTYSGVVRPRNITVRAVEGYRTWLAERESGRGILGGDTTLSAKTQNYHLTALRTFLKYLRKRHITTLDPKEVALAKVAPRVCGDVLSSTECARVLDAPEGSDLKTLRDRALLYVLVSTRLKVAEVCALDARTYTRVISLTSEARRAVCVWVAARHDTEEALFIALGPRAVVGENRLTPRSIQRIVKHYAAQAGVPHTVTPESFRTNVVA
jgi:site-specific recombinase XerD